MSEDRQYMDCSIEDMLAHRLSERAAIVAWLDQWAAVPSSGDKQYHAGWSMAMFNAAREIERGDHLPHPKGGIDG